MARRYSLPLLLAIGGCATVAPVPHPPQGEIALDAADPVVEAIVAGVLLRLRVDLSAHDTIELNPAAARRLALKYEDGPDVLVGRVLLTGRTAIASVRIGAVERRLQVVEHGRDCCAGVDGAIGPQSLPFGRVQWRNDDAPAATGELIMQLDDDDATGLSAASAQGTPTVRIRFAPDQRDSGATASAGALLAKSQGARWDGSETDTLAAFGVRRPARSMLLGRPVTLAGFRFDRLLVRTADFGGGEQLPADPIAPDEIVVTKRLPRQEAWPAVTIGADRLSRCARITFIAEPRSLTLACAFD
jgi:hypothetical protein